MIDKMENGKDKAVGKIKETAGKWMDDEGLEFQGKMQGIKGNIGEKTEDMKESVMEKANDLIDKVKGDKRNKNNDMDNR